MIQFLTAFISTAFAFAVIDLLWITNVARPYIFTKIEHLFEINITAAVLFYIIYICGILLFAVYPALNASSGNMWKLALLMGALFGFFCYATYDLTNMATLRDWAWYMVIGDVLWGTIMTGLAASFGYWVTRMLG